MVKNFAVIDAAELELTTGLNILSGETGAGKSIITRALDMLLGGRASTDFIRSGKEKAIIEACFDISNNPLIEEKAEELGIELSADNNLILTREISHTTNNKSRINGRIVNLETTRKLSQYLIDVHAQHEYQKLLSSVDQLAIIDELGGEEAADLKQKVKDLYHKLQEKKQRLTELNQSEKERERRIDLLEFQLDEIESAELEIGEEEELRAKRKKLGNAEELSETLGDVYTQLYESDFQQSAIIDKISQFVKQIDKMSDLDEELEEIAEQLRETNYQLEDVAYKLRDYQDRIELNPQKLTAVEEKLNEINNLKRKYGDNIKEILTYRDEIKEELTTLKNSKQRKQELTAEIDELEAEYCKQAKKLSSLRQEIAADFAAKVVDELADLAITQAEFKVKFQQREEFSQLGIDKIEFLFAPNPGSDLKPLAEIASGGELSRVMLALKTITAELDQLSTLVFDEIDAGIGGRVAKLVAQKLTELAANYQVLCITHLPQIASQADHHYLIEKKVEAETTFVDLFPLNQEQRKKELARMLDGSLTETTLQHAEELIKNEN